MSADVARRAAMPPRRGFDLSEFRREMNRQLRRQREQEQKLQAKREREKQEAARKAAEQLAAAQAEQKRKEDEIAAKPADQSTAEQTQHESDRGQKWALWVQVACAVVQVICSLAIIAFTAGQVVVGYWQWDATNKQYKVMMADQRPWVIIEPNKAWIAKVGEPLSTAITMKNSGKSPAIIKEITFRASIDPMPEVGVDKYMEEFCRQYRQFSDPERTEILPPDSTYEASLRGGQLVEADTFANLQGRKSIFACAGRIRYLDSAGVSHVTERFFLYNPSVNAMRPYRDYNKMD